MANSRNANRAISVNHLIEDAVGTNLPGTEALAAGDNGSKCPACAVFALEPT